MVTLDELTALFTGVEHEDGGWETSPVPSIALAFEIAARLEPTTEMGLRKHLYGERALDDIEPEALQAINLGYARWISVRQIAKAA